MYVICVTLSVHHTAHLKRLKMGWKLFFFKTKVSKVFVLKIENIEQGISITILNNS